MRLGEAGLPARLLATLFLGGATATVLLGEGLAWRTYARADGAPGLSVTDLEVSFTGRARSLFEARVRGEMRQYLASKDELATLVGWAAAGAGEAGYRADVAPLLEDRCVGCHSPEGRAGFRPLTTLAEVRDAVRAPPAPSFAWQVLVTKVHLAGLSLLFGATSALLVATALSPRVQAALVVATFGGLFCDFASWWGMRLHLAFAWGRIGGNGVMVAAFAASVVVCLRELWVARRSS